MPHLGLVYLAWIIGTTITPNAPGAELALSPTLAGNSIQVDWTSRSLTPTPPYLHYEFQIEQSADLIEWTPVGQRFLGGNSSQQQVQWSPSFPIQARAQFYRLTAQLNPSGINLSGLDLKGQDLSGSNLQGIDLSQSNLTGADLSGANLSSANLAGTQLSGTRWQGTHIQGVNLDQVPLAGVDFYGSTGVPQWKQLAGTPSATAASQLPILPLRTSQGDFGDTTTLQGSLGLSRSNIIVLLKPGTTTAQLNAFLTRQNASIIGSLPINTTNGIAAISLQIPLPNNTAENLYQYTLSLQQDPIVDTASPDALMGFDIVSNDASSARHSSGDWTWDQGHLVGGGNWGLEFARVPSLWNVKDALTKRGSSYVPVVVLDGGFPYHDDIDMFRMNLGVPMGAPDHGIHVAGTIGASFDNNLGIDGVNPFALLYGYTYETSLLKAIPTSNAGQIIQNQLRASTAYLFCQNTFYMLRDVPTARVANFSLGYNWVQNREPDHLTPSIAHAMALSHGLVFSQIAALYPEVLFIGAAGNDHLNIPARDNSPLGAAGLIYGAPNILVVESHDTTGGRSSFSNAGGNLAAPGSFILSLSTNNTYEVMSGTSMATPFVSGVASFLIATDPNLTIPELRSLLISREFNLDAYQTLLKIDDLPGRDRLVARMLLDVDDGSMDGNTRIQPPASSPLGDRNFLATTDGESVAETDFDGDGGLGNGTIDMADFRVFRDHLQLAEEGVRIDSSLNGEFLTKWDANANREFEGDGEALRYPRFDFNGDGKLDRASLHQAGRYAAGEGITDAALFSFSDLWSDPFYSFNDGLFLMDSADVTVSARNVFIKYPDLPSVEVWLLDGKTLAKLGKPRQFSRSQDTFIFTVPLDQTYLFGSDPFPRSASSKAALRSIAPFQVTTNHRGADFAVDLTYAEMTVLYSTTEPSHFNSQSEPFKRSVEAAIPELVTQDTTGHPPSAYANDQATLYAYSRSDPFQNADPEKQTAHVATVEWTRSFSKIPGARDPQFHVKPIRLKLGDQDSLTNELRASTRITLERRTGPATNAVWRTIFSSYTEIAGSGQTDTHPHTFRVVRHTGAFPPPTPVFTNDFSGKIVGMEVSFPDFYDTISLHDLQNHASFELRYRLEAESLGPVNISNPCDGECIAEAYVGDPLDYGSGTTMRYGDFGELFQLLEVKQNNPPNTEITYTSSPHFTFTLYRQTTNSTQEIPVSVRLGVAGTGSFLDPTAPAGVVLNQYRLHPTPLDQKHDADNDGIDDFFELSHPEILNPLNPGDAALDPDADGFSSLAEYQRGTDPATKDNPTPLLPGPYPSPMTTLSLGNLARSADLNHDGQPDLISLGGNSGGFVTQLGNPDGSFQIPIETELSWFPGFAMDMQPFRPDSNQEVHLAITALVTNRLFIYRHTGDGRFALLQNLPTGSNPRRLHIADINQDGTQDLLVVNDRSLSVSRYLGSTTGSFTPISDINLNGYGFTLDVTTGDFNKDGFLDIACSVNSDKVVVFLAQANGTYQTPRSFTVDFFPENISTADLDGDGWLDLLTTSVNQDSLSILYNNTAGSFLPESRIRLPDAPVGMRVADLNQDGPSDLIISHRSGLFSTLLGQPSRTTLSIALYGGQMPDEPLADDFNQDGNIDLMAGNSDRQALVRGLPSGAMDAPSVSYSAESSWSFMNQESSSTASTARFAAINTLSNALEILELNTPSSHRVLQRIPLPSFPAGLALGDLNGDSWPDALAATSQQITFFGTNGTNQLLIFTGDDSGNYHPGTALSLNSVPHHIAIADIDGDARQDILVTHFDPPQLVAYLQTHAGQFVRQTPFALNNAPDHLNGYLRENSSKADVLLSGYGQNAQILRWTGSTWSLFQTLGETEYALTLEPLDYDGDGDLDLLVSQQDGSQPRIEVRLNQQGTLSNGQILLSPSFAGFAHLLDINGDGRKDLLIDDTSSTVAVYLATVGGGWTTPSFHGLNQPSNPGIQEQPLFVHDLNGDGRPDLIRGGGPQFQTLLHR